MRTDRELLELAAKAAGMRLEWDGHPDAWQPMYYEGKTYHSWDPLTDDGDALRLAVKLRMMLDDIRKGYQAGCVVAVSGDSCCYEPREPNPDAAMRRAIVRAAAEIGAHPKQHNDGGADE